MGNETTINLHRSMHQREAPRFAARHDRLLNHPGPIAPGGKEGRRWMILEDPVPWPARGGSRRRWGSGDGRLVVDDGSLWLF